MEHYFKFRRSQVPSECIEGCDGVSVVLIKLILVWINLINNQLVCVNEWFVYYCVCDKHWYADNWDLLAIHWVKQVGCILKHFWNWLEEDCQVMMEDHWNAHFHLFHLLGSNMCFYWKVRDGSSWKSGSSMCWTENDKLYMIAYKCHRSSSKRIEIDCVRCYNKTSMEYRLLSSRSSSY